MDQADKDPKPVDETLLQDFDLKYERDRDVDPLTLVANAGLALHHHMAPADGSFDFELEDETD